MKVTINEKQTEGEVKYPCLMKHKTSNRYILMLSDNTGVWLSNLDGEYGYYATSLVMYNFTPFKGSITLEND